MYKHQIVFKEERVFGGFCELRVLLKIFKLFVYGSVGGGLAAMTAKSK